MTVLLDLDVHFPKQDQYEEIVHGKILRSWFTRMISNASYKSQWLSQLAAISTLVYGHQAAQTWRDDSPFLAPYEEQ